MTEKTAKILRQIIRKCYNSNISSLYHDIIEKCGLNPSVDLCSIIEACGIYDPDICPYDLSGHHFCELPESHYLLSNDLFLVSKLYTNFGFDSDTSAYASESMTYELLYTALLTDITSIMNETLCVHTMAYEDTETYIRVDHEHPGQYSNVSANLPSNSRLLATFTTYLSDYIVFDGYEEDYPHHAITHVDESKKIVYRMYEPIQKPDIKPGTLKFVARRSVNRTIDINSTDFDGWVYADGLTYTITNTTRFADALSLYRTGPSSNSIKVPDFKTFFLLNPGTTTYNAYGYENSQLGLFPHKHKIESASMKLDISNIKHSEITITTCNSSSRTDANGLSSHIWSPPETSRANEPFVVEVKPGDYKVTGFTTTASTESTLEPRPTHMIVPIMVYIGGVT